MLILISLSFSAPDPCTLGRFKYISETAFFRPDMHLHIYRLHSARAIDSFRKLAESSRESLQKKKSELLVVMKRVASGWEDGAIWETEEAIPGLQCVVIFLPVSQVELLERTRKDNTMDNSRADEPVTTTPMPSTLPTRDDVSRICVSRFVSLRTREIETIIVPVYNARALWGDERAAEMRGVAVEALGGVEKVGTGLLVVGVMTGIQSKKFALEMWKMREWLD